MQYLQMGVEHRQVDPLTREPTMVCNTFKWGYSIKYSGNYKKMVYDFADGKTTTLIDTLKNQSFYIRTHYMIKLFYDDYQSDAIVFKKV